MMKAWRSLAVATALVVTVGIGVAGAQTVVVRQAPAGAAIELIVNAVPAGSVKADANGDAIIPLSLFTQESKTESDAQVALEVCGEVRRVLIQERGILPPPIPDGCDRRDIAGVFLIRRITTLVMNVGGAVPTLLLIQGDYSLEPPTPGTLWLGVPNGLILSGGGGLSKFRDASAIACGTATTCDGDDSGGALSGSVAFWFNPYLAAEATYLKPADASASGNGDIYRFTSFLDAQLLTVGGKVGVPFGPVRLFGNVGASYHWATFGTSQTTEDLTITVDGVAQTITGGTQALQLETSGWGWTFGGGIEAWLTRQVGFFGEVGRAQVKGPAVEDGEGELDDALTTVLVGIRLRIGR